LPALSPADTELEGDPIALRSASVTKDGASDEENDETFVTRSDPLQIRLSADRVTK